MRLFRWYSTDDAAGRATRGAIPSSTHRDPNRSLGVVPLAFAYQRDSTSRLEHRKCIVGQRHLVNSRGGAPRRIEEEVGT
jgi:hypothetical protein